MVHALRRNRVFFVLGLLIAFLLGLQAGRMLPPSTPLGWSADAGARLADRATTVVLKKFSAGFLPTEAQAAELSSSTVVRKKLPEAPAPAEPAQAAGDKSVEPKPGNATAAPPNVVLKKVPEPPAAVVTASPAPAEITPDAVTAKPAESKPAEAVAASPAPAPAPAAAASVPPPAVAAAPATKAVAKPAAGVTRFPFSILLASCQDRRNAEAALASYRRLGLAPYVVQTDLGPKGVWWRTLTGAYPSYDEAMAAKQGPALAQAVVVKTPYADLVGEYGTDAEATAAATALARKGLFPYLLKSPGSVQLLTGAFPAQAAAEDFRRELEALGIPARAVQR